MATTTTLIPNFDLRGAFVSSQPLTVFPPDPTPDTLVLKDGVLWVWSRLGDSFSWNALTNSSNTYLSVQTQASDRWIVQHFLNSTTFVYAVYDDLGQELSVMALTNVQPNEFTLVFRQPCTGRVLVFAQVVSPPAVVEVDTLVAKAIVVADGKIVGNNTGLTVDGTTVARLNEFNQFSGGPISGKV